MLDLDPSLAIRFPKSAAYNPDWIRANCMGANSLWITEWLSASMVLSPGMRMLDLGCGRAVSSVFLAREFGVQVWATDLWISASDNARRIRDAGLDQQIFPLHADARALPFAGEFFDAIFCVDAFPYFGTDALYLNYLAHFVKPRGQIGIAGAGLMNELDSPLPEHLASHWTQDLWSLQAAPWWRRHWERTGIVEIELADTLADGWQVWLDWHRKAHGHNLDEIAMLEADRGEHLGYVRVIGRRRENVKLEDYCWPDTMRSMPDSYKPLPVLKERIP